MIRKTGDDEMKIVEKLLNIVCINAMFAYGRICKKTYLRKSRKASEVSRKFLMKQLRRSRQGLSSRDRSGKKSMTAARTSPLRHHHPNGHQMWGRLGDGGRPTSLAF